MQLGSLVDRLDDRLHVDDYAAADPSMNGLQVGTRDREIEHVVGAVDAALEPIEAAADAGGDLLVVHHGLFWSDGEPLTGYRFERIRALIDAGLALYGVHLPLDGHQTLGNAAGIADGLELTDREPFAMVGGQPIGLVGHLPSPMQPASLHTSLEVLLDSDTLPQLGSPPSTVETVAIVTGSGTGYIEAAAAEADVLITGEGKHAAYHEAADAGTWVILGGHYRTETFGIRALLSLLEGWGLETTFVDIPTGI